MSRGRFVNRPYDVLRTLMANLIVGTGLPDGPINII